MAPLETTSSDGRITIKLSGSQPSQFDPWTVNIEASAYGKEYSTFQEVYADELDTSNVTFKWVSEETCKVTFTQRDGTTVTVPITIQKRE